MKQEKLEDQEGSKVRKERGKEGDIRDVKDRELT